MCYSVHIQFTYSVLSMDFFKRENYIAIINSNTYLQSSKFPYGPCGQSLPSVIPVHHYLLSVPGVLPLLEHHTHGILDIQCCSPSLGVRFGSHPCTAYWQHLCCIVSVAVWLCHHFFKSACTVSIVVAIISRFSQEPQTCLT